MPGNGTGTYGLAPITGKLLSYGQAGLRGALKASYLVRTRWEVCSWELIVLELEVYIPHHAGRKTQEDLTPLRYKNNWRTAFVRRGNLSFRHAYRNFCSYTFDVKSEHNGYERTSAQIISSIPEVCRAAGINGNRIAEISALSQLKETQLKDWYFCVVFRAAKKRNTVFGFNNNGVSGLLFPLRDTSQKFVTVTPGACVLHLHDYLHLARSTGSRHVHKTKREKPHFPHVAKDNYGIVRNLHSCTQNCLQGKKLRRFKHSSSRSPRFNWNNYARANAEDKMKQLPCYSANGAAHWASQRYTNV